MKRHFLYGALAGLLPSLACALVVTLAAVYDAAEQRREQREAGDTRNLPGYGDNR